MAWPRAGAIGAAGVGRADAATRPRTACPTTRPQGPSTRPLDQAVAARPHPGRARPGLCASACSAACPSMRWRRTALALTGFVAERPVVAPLLYMLAYVAVVAFSLPGGAVMTLAGGFLFGPWLGAAAAVVAATLGACALFLAARYCPGRDAGAPRRAADGQGAGRAAAGRVLATCCRCGCCRWCPSGSSTWPRRWPGCGCCPMRRRPSSGSSRAPSSSPAIGAGLGQVFDAGGKPDLSIIFSPGILLPLLGLAALSLAGPGGAAGRARLHERATSTMPRLRRGGDRRRRRRPLGRGDRRRPRPKVALIERGRMGGDCLNYGCVPSKALLAAGHAAAEARARRPLRHPPAGARDRLGRRSAPMSRAPSPASRPMTAPARSAAWGSR